MFAQCPVNWQLNTIGWTDGFNGYIPGSMVTATASYSNFNNFAITTPFTTGVQTGIHTAGNAADCPSCFDLANPVSGGYIFYETGSDNINGSDLIITYTLSQPVTDPYFYIGHTGVEPQTTLDFSGTLGLTSVVRIDGNDKFTVTGNVASNSTSNSNFPQA
jgi:hypothetical protein